MPYVDASSHEAILATVHVSTRGALHTLQLKPSNDAPARRLFSCTKIRRGIDLGHPSIFREWISGGPLHMELSKRATVQTESN